MLRSKSSHDYPFGETVITGLCICAVSHQRTVQLGSLSSQGWELDSQSSHDWPVRESSQDYPIGEASQDYPVGESVITGLCSWEVSHHSTLQ